MRRIKHHAYGHPSECGWVHRGHNAACGPDGVLEAAGVFIMRSGEAPVILAATSSLEAGQAPAALGGAARHLFTS